jgi:uncharacterized metal-binding protein YceD (DUF177 family)
MLRYDLAEIIRTPGMRQVYEISEPPYTDEDVEYVSPLTGRVAVTNTGTMVLVRGIVQVTINMECSRCLETVRVPIDAEIEEEFDLKVVEDATHHDKVVQVVEDEVGLVLDGKVLQLDVLIRQATLLAAPLRALCREDCPGIPIKSAQTDSEDGSRKLPFQDLSKYLNN